MLKKTSLFILCFLCFGILFAQDDNRGILIDEYVNNSKEHIEVLFFDPSVAINQIYPHFFSSDFTIDENQKRKIWIKYLHNSVLYLFKVKNLKTNELQYYCFGGDSAVKRSSKYFQVESINSDSLELENPNTQNYNIYINKRYKVKDVGGSLFENMKIFSSENDKNNVGKGILFLGKYFRIVPYNDVKQAVERIIRIDKKQK